jgi:dephospho-CoA kinase
MYTPNLVQYPNFSSYIIVIGLTGGIATGKSTVSRQLAARNIPVIDADILARDVVRPGTRTLNKIVSTFGPEILKEDGALDRPKLGAIVFRDEEQRRKLNAIVHPAVRWAMVLGVLKYWFHGERVCVLDVPLLIESKIYQWVGRVIVVYWFVPFELAHDPAIDDQWRAALPKYSYRGSCSAMRRRARIHERDWWPNFLSHRNSSMLTLWWIIREHKQSSRFKWMSWPGGCILKEDGHGDLSG